MDNEFSGYFWKSVGLAILYTVIIDVVIVVIFSGSDNSYLLAFLISFLLLPIIFYFQLKSSCVNKINQEVFNNRQAAINSENIVKNNEKFLEACKHKADVWQQSLKEKTSGFPTLFNYIELLDKYIDDFAANMLLQKARPAPRAAEEVKEQSRRRRVAEKQLRITQEIIEFYEQLEPSLIDYKNEEFGNIEEILQEWTEEEKEDPVTFFVNKDEYRKLTETERNQLALDRYWHRPHSRWHIGIMYERYIGYLYEQMGYQVIYQGAKTGKRDLGRDLIAQKGHEVIVIQCKYWSQFRNVFENEIFQFFGTVFQYKHANKSQKVKGIFYTTTTVSDLARSFAEELHIELKEDYKMDKKYPCIKCNISRSDKKQIYHLPFDQQYDNIVIEPDTGEFYCSTTKEAENRGFRRAWRWHETDQ